MVLLAQDYNETNVHNLFYVHNNVQMNLGLPVTLVWMTLNHQVLLAWQQVSVGNII